VIREQVVRALMAAASEGMGKVAEETHASSSEVCSAVATQMHNIVLIAKERGGSMAAVREVITKILLECDESNGKVM
jgi:hypothetical protein